MPIAKIQLPDGRIAKFEVPEGTSQEQVLSFAQSQFSNMEAPKPEVNLEGTAASRFVKGVGQGLSDFVGGALQTGAEIAGAEDFANLIAEAKQRTDARSEQMGSAYKAGEIVGGIAPAVALPAGVGAGLVTRAAIGAGTGALTSAIAPRAETMTAEQSLAQRGEQAQTGALIGAAVPVGLSSARNIIPTGGKVISRLFDVSPEKVQIMEQAGLKPTLATVGGRSSKIIEKTFSEVPVVSDVVTKDAERLLEKTQSIISNIAANSKPVFTKEGAGEVVQKGLQGFVNRFNETGNSLYKNLDKYIDPNKAVKIDNFLGYLNNSADNLTPALKKTLEHPKIQKIAKAVAEDAADTNTLPYKTIKQVRTTIGELLSDKTIQRDITQQELNRLYGALSQDMKQAAFDAGEDATKAFNRANNYWAAGSTRINDYLNNIIKKTEPAAVYKTLQTSTKDGLKQLNVIKKSLKPEEFDAFRGFFIDQMGKARASSQNAAGDAFSINSFMTSWNNLSPKAKGVLFGGKFAEQGRALNRIAQAGEQIKSVEALANTSGTARNLVGSAAGVGLVLEPVTSSTILLTGFGTAKLMTNPKFVKWLAEGTKLKSPKAITNHLGKLAAVANSSPEIAQDISDYINSLGE